MLCARPLASAVTSGKTGVYADAPSPLQEFSVVYTDRALNHMSQPFQQVMLGIGDTLKGVYKAKSCVIIPGGGTFGMEAVARQFAQDKHALVIRNGFFSFRWTQIFEKCGIAKSHTVLNASAVKCCQECGGVKAQYAPPPIEKVVATILEERPGVVFAPHVETSVGMILPDDYIKQVASAVHQVGGLFVLDCIASGTVWVDMQELGLDAVISAPQKGWSGPACAALVMLSEKGTEVARQTQSTSYSCDLRKWLEVMDAYEAGGHMYHATMPTDALVAAYSAMRETQAVGWQKAQGQAWELGRQTRQMFKDKGLVSVAAEGFEAPGVVVVHHDDAGVAGKFAAAGTQIAAGVPFMIGEPAGTVTFRIGLFGLEKLADPAKTVANLKKAVDVAIQGDVPKGSVYMDL